MGERARPRKQAADPIPDGSSGLCPIDEAILLFDLGGIGNALGGLGTALNSVGNVIGNGLHKQPGADLSESIVQRF